MTWETVAVISLALGIGALCKGATGMGLPLIAVPVLASFLGLPHAIAVLTVPNLVSNVWQLWSHRSEWTSMPFLPRLLAGGLIGIIGGTVLLKFAPARALELALGSILALYLALRITRPQFGLSSKASMNASPGAGLIAGALQGATGIASPALVTFLHAMRLKRESFILAISSSFLLFGCVQLPSLAVMGLLTWPRLVESVVALVPVLLLMPVGAFLARRTGQSVFDRLVLAFIAVMSVRFITGGLGWTPFQ